MRLGEIFFCPTRAVTPQTSRASFQSLNQGGTAQQKRCAAPPISAPSGPSPGTFTRSPAPNHSLANDSHFVRRSFPLSKGKRNAKQSRGIGDTDSRYWDSSPATLEKRYYGG
jgi:hypothetical protein